MRLLLQMSIIVFLLTGCSADPQTGGPPPAHWDAGPPRPDAEPGRVDPPTLAPMPTSTYWPAIPVHGHGPSGGTILLTTPKTGALTVPVGTTGDFCVDVPLEAGVLNQFSLRAQDRDGNLSEPVQAQIRQEGSPPPPPMPGQPVNVSIGGSVQTTLWGSLINWNNNTTNNMIDNDMSTVLEGYNRGLFGTPPDFAWVLLSARSSVNRVHVFSPSDCKLGAYSVLISNRDAPGDPSESNSNWIKVGEVTAGTGDDDLPFQPAYATQVALFFKSHDCGGALPGYHKVEELQTWTQADQPPPPPTQPTCNGGG
ncbi:MAG TPA: hypothetical protein VKN99_27800 [Polyangia bacterium]|nr:hypothetical protein [Polyangia bacterium]